MLISRFQSSPPVPLTLTDDGEPVTLLVTANPRQVEQGARARGEGRRHPEVSTPRCWTTRRTSAFTLALTENDVPGGHSPAYFALLNQPAPLSPFVWTNDPVSFPSYPSFFIAHEIAHQWWGQAVGWKNYHEQWLSEGFAQYFAALYAERERGAEQFAQRAAPDAQVGDRAVAAGTGLSRLPARPHPRRGRARSARWSTTRARWCCTCCGAWSATTPFFAGLRDFYATWRYRKAGTDDFRAAMEKASGSTLERFFDRWIFGSGIPHVQFSSQVAGNALRSASSRRGTCSTSP